MTKSQQEETPGQDSTAVSQETTDTVSAEQGPRHGSHVVNGTIYQGSVSGTRNIGQHEERGGGGISIHSFRATQVDGSSYVLNGSVSTGPKQPGLCVHRVDEGSVKKNSKLVNGDLTVDEFRRIFCNGR